MYRAYIIGRNYQRTFQSPWFKSEREAELALEQRYKQLGLDPKDPNVFGSGIEEDSDV